MLVEQHPRGLRAVRAGERERPGAELGGEHAGEVPGGVAESRGEAGHALALDDAVGDEPHGPRGEVVAQVPLGGAGHGVGQAALAGPQPGLVRGGGREVEAHVRGLRRHRGAARAAVDAGRVHARDELPVEPRVARAHGTVALGEHGVAERVAGPVPGGRRGGCGLRHAPSLARATDTGRRKSDMAAVDRVEGCRTPSSPACRTPSGHAVTTDPDALEATRDDRSGWRSASLPIAVVHATSVDDVQAVMRIAHATGTPVVPRGAGTGLAGGAIASPGAIVLDLSRMNRILEISDADELAVVEPGVLNGDLNDLLAAARPLVRARSREPRDLDDRRQHRHERRRPAAARSTA